VEECGPLAPGVALHRSGRGTRGGGARAPHHRQGRHVVHHMLPTSLFARHIIQRMPATSSTGPDVEHKVAARGRHITGGGPGPMTRLRHPYDNPVTLVPSPAQLRLQHLGGIGILSVEREREGERERQRQTLPRVCGGTRISPWPPWKRETHPRV